MWTNIGIMSSLRTPATIPDSELFNELATFAAKYIKNPEQLRQYNSAEKRTLFEENFMTEKEFVTEFAKLERTVGPTWPLNKFHSESNRPYFTGTLSEKICSYVINSLYPEKFFLKTSTVANDEPWYLFFNRKFKDFNFLDYTPSAGEQPLQKLNEYLSNKRTEINTREKVATGPELLPERVLVQNMIHFLSSLSGDRLPAIRKSKYSIVGFKHRENWRQELGKVYYMSHGAATRKNTLLF